MRRNGGLGLNGSERSSSLGDDVGLYDPRNKRVDISPNQHTRAGPWDVPGAALSQSRLRRGPRCSKSGWLLGHRRAAAALPDPTPSTQLSRRRSSPRGWKVGQSEFTQVVLAPLARLLRSPGITPWPSPTWRSGRPRPQACGPGKRRRPCAGPGRAEARAAPSRPSPCRARPPRRGAGGGRGGALGSV